MKNPITTLTGIALLIIAILTATGVVGPEDQQTLGEYATAAIEAIAGIISIFFGSDGKNNPTGP